MKELYLATYQPKGLMGQDASWLKTLREKAFAYFEREGFPTVKNEHWKYTDLSVRLSGLGPFIETSFVTKTVLAAQLKAKGFQTEKAHVAVFVNGKFSKELSSLGTMAKGMKVQSLAGSLSTDEVERNLGKTLGFEGRPLTALNIFSFSDGLFVRIEKGQHLAQPIHAVYLSANDKGATQSHPRNLLLLEQDSRAEIIEHYWGDNTSPYLTNVVTEVHLDRGAVLEHTKILREDEKGYHIGTLAVTQDEGSRLVSRTFSLGGALGRSEVETCLAGRNAECLLEGLTVAKGHQHMDIRTFVDHAVPGCKSEQVFKSVLDHEAVSIFDGRVLVRENAQKTDAKQSNKNLLLSKKALVYSKPQLQIYADDVKCSHGSATGQLDEEAVFYLRSRGIGKEEARKTLVYAFAGEMVQRVGENGLKAPVHKLVNQAMGWESEAL